MILKKFSILNFKFSIPFLVLILCFLFNPGLVFAQVATLSLDPATGTFNTTCGFSLNVNLDTGGAQTDGTDAIIFYDASKLNAISVNNGTIYPDYPGNNIDASTGKITISGLASVSTPFTGKGVLATLNFSVKDTASTGVTQMTFDFDPNNKAKTTDSNVVQRGNPVVDVLNSVVNGNYTIGTGNCGTPAATTLPATGGGQGGIGGATPSAAPITKTLPPAGTEQFTYTLAIIGSVLTVLGVLGIALL